MHQEVCLVVCPKIHPLFTLQNTSDEAVAAQVCLHIYVDLLNVTIPDLHLFTRISIRHHSARQLKHFAAQRKPGESLALLDEKQTANISSGTGNKSPLRCYDMNDNSASVCLLGRVGFVSTRRVQPGLTRDRESRMHFHKSFLDTTSRLCGWQSVACKLPLHWQCKGAPLGFK